MNRNNLKRIEDHSLQYLKEARPYDRGSLLTPSSGDKNVNKILKKKVVNQEGQTLKSTGPLSKARSLNIEEKVKDSKGKKRCRRRQLPLPLSLSLWEKGDFAPYKNMNAKRSLTNLYMNKEAPNSSLTDCTVHRHICTPPCPCMKRFRLSDKQKQFDIVVQIHQDPDTENSETSIYIQTPLDEPEMLDKKSLSSLVNAQYES